MSATVTISLEEFDSLRDEREKLRLISNLLSLKAPISRTATYLTYSGEIEGGVEQVDISNDDMELLLLELHGIIEDVGR